MNDRSKRFRRGRVLRLVLASIAAGTLLTGFLGQLASARSAAHRRMRGVVLVPSDGAHIYGWISISAGHGFRRVSFHRSESRPLTKLTTADYGVERHELRAMLEGGAQSVIIDSARVPFSALYRRQVVVDSNDNSGRPAAPFPAWMSRPGLPQVYWRGWLLVPAFPGFALSVAANELLCLSIFGGVAWAKSRFSARRHVRPGYCAKCRYWSGSPTASNCPECGRVLGARHD